MWKQFKKIFGFSGKQYGLALGSGGARGMAHIGVLQALEEHEYEITAISGTSAGSIVAAIYASEPDWQVVAQKFQDYLENNKEYKETFKQFDQKSGADRSKLYNIRESISKFFMWTRLVGGRSIIQDDILISMTKALVPDKQFSELSIPLAVVAYDLIGAQERIFTSGSVIDAVIASSSIPGVFPPREKDGMFLVDGGAISPVPVDAVISLGAKKVIAIDVSPLSAKPVKCNSGLEILFRVIDGNAEKLKQIELSRANIIIVPRIKGIEWWRFEYYSEIEKRGYEAAINELRTES